MTVYVVVYEVTDTSSTILGVCASSTAVDTLIEPLKKRFGGVWVKSRSGWVQEGSNAAFCIKEHQLVR